jgi:hypothetical protein
VADQAAVDQFDGDVAFEASVAAPRAPHGAHPAHAERLFERVGADRLAGQRRGRLIGSDGSFEKRGVEELRVLVEQLRQQAGQLRPIALDFVEERRLALRVEIQRAIQQRTDGVPQLLVQT